MGIVQNQSFKNTIITYIGFAFGAINTLFLYTNFISDNYYGLITVILSTALILMPLLAFGVHNTLIKFFSSFKTKEGLHSFLTLMLVLPLILIIPIASIIYFGYNPIAELISNENAIIKDYLWHIFITGIALAYFEVFYAWSKVHLQSVFGNFMKEVFHRACIMLLLFLVYLKYLNVEQLITGIVLVYLLRMLIMMLYAFSLRLPVLKLKRPDNFIEIIKYSGLIIIAGSVSVLLLDIDKFMISQYIKIEEVAYYGVAIYIASVIAVPSRSLQQIANPLTANFLNNNDYSSLKSLYHKSSINLLIISGLIFILIITNIHDLYKIVPDEFSGGFYVVFMVGIAKLFDSLLGNNNAILFNSDYYRMVLVLGVFLALLTVFFNIIFIPRYGIEGAAFATFLAIFIYNTSKMLFVKVKLNMLPFTKKTMYVFILLIVFSLLFYFLELSFHPIINIGFKGLLITSLYALLVYKFDLSEDISKIIDSYLKRKV